MNSWIPKCQCELFNERKNKKRGYIYMYVVTRVWSWIGKHSLTLVTWHRNWGPGGGWVSLGKSLAKAWFITP